MTIHRIFCFGYYENETESIALGSGILVVPKRRDYEIQRIAGSFVLEKTISSAPKK